MEKKMIKKLLAIFMIITILATDFFTLGSALITYAELINSETNNENIKFSVYFKEGEEDRIYSTEQDIKNEDVKLYAEIIANGEDGYLTEGTTIDVINSNFNITSVKVVEKNNSTSTITASLEENKITLSQINAGEVVELELGIKSIMPDKMPKDFLSMLSTLRLTSNYIYSESETGAPITADKSVEVRYQPNEKVPAELETKVTTNKILSVNGTDQRVVQLLIKSRLLENKYPVEQTTLNVGIPALGEELPKVSVMALGELATNGTKEINNNNYTIVQDKDGVDNLQITLKNEANTTGEIKWSKDVYDELVVTYIYDSNVDASDINIKTMSEISIYNFLEKSGTESNASYTLGDIVDESNVANEVIIGRTEITTEEMYKGQLYANSVSENDVQVEYKTKTTLGITNKDVADKITIKEGPDTFVIDEKNELTEETKYLSTKINLDQMLNILGENGNIQIKNGKTTTIINQEITTNENITIDANRNVEIKHIDSTAELEIIITTSDEEGIAKEGILEIYHTKAITKISNDRTTMKTTKALKAKGTVLATLEETEVVKKPTETSDSSLELKETISKAELTIIDKEDRELSTTVDTNEVSLGVTLVTNGVQYDLYSNPTIRLELPQTVKDVPSVNVRKAYDYAGEFGEPAYTIKNENGQKILEITLTGEQKEYPSEQLYLLIDLNIKVSELAPTQTDKITMKYVNSNATQYADGGKTFGIDEQEVNIISTPGLVKMFNLSSNENTSLKEDITQLIKGNEVGENLSFEAILINNTNSTINNVKILGKLPTTGISIEGKENTFETTLTSIEAPNATIYYTENVNATFDTDIDTNGWTTELNTLTNAKLYLIKLDTLANANIYKANININIPKTIPEDVVSYTEYEVIYDEITTSEKTRKIGLMTSLIAGLETNLTATVGKDNLLDGALVKEGEVIKYTATVTNTLNTTLQNVQLKVDIPEGTVLVEPKLNDENGVDYVYTLYTYYIEKTDITEISEEIIELKQGETYTKQFEVRINKGTAGKEISNNVTTIYNNYEKNGAELKNKIEESNIRVTIKRGIDLDIKLIPGNEIIYNVIVENLLNENINNIELNILTDNLVDTQIKQYIAVDNKVIYKLTGKIKEDASDMYVVVEVKDPKGKYRSNIQQEEFPDVGAEVTLSSPQKEDIYLKMGQEIEYNIKVKNIGEVEKQFYIYDNIPENLDIQAIYINGNIDKQITDSTDESTYVQSISNNQIIAKDLKPDEQVQIKVITKVKDIFETQTITNKVEVKVNDVLLSTSEEVTHTLVSESEEVDQLKNMISGYVWLDADEDGKQDSSESALSEITVRIYDPLTNSYLDEAGTVIYQITNDMGGYSFTKIPNGSYIIVFEVDLESYEPTINGEDTEQGSKAALRNIAINGEIKTVAGIEINNLQDNVTNMNIGLKQKTKTPVTPENPDDPKQPGTPDDSQQPENPDDPQQPGETSELRTITGCAWLDENRNGQKDDNEKVLSEIKVKLYDASTKDYLKNKNGKVIEVTTDKAGKYTVNDIEKGVYILIFEYDTEEYEPTTYLADGVDTAKNSKVILKNINISGKEMIAAVTDTVNVQDNVSNINIGLKEKLIFDLELNKYISRIVIQNNKETKAYDYSNATIAKVEIHRKQIEGALVVLEYTIKVKNNGEVAGYAKNIVDYLPSGLTFSSELNKDWYLSGNYLYTKGLENVEINPGEEKEIKLILTKTMTGENVGHINNRAEIYQDYNKYGNVDIDSTPNNQVQDEDDFGIVDVIIAISTGGSSIAYIILIMINVVLIGIAIKLMIKNGIIKISTKKGRR